MKNNDPASSLSLPFFRSASGVRSSKDLASRQKVKKVAKNVCPLYAVALIQPSAGRPFLSGLLCICGLTLERGNGIPISIIPMAFLGVVSQVGPTLCLAVLAKLAGPNLLRDLQFTGTSRHEMLLGTSFGSCRSHVCFLGLCLERSIVLCIHDLLDCL